MNFYWIVYSTHLFSEVIINAVFASLITEGIVVIYMDALIIP